MNPLDQYFRLSDIQQGMKEMRTTGAAFVPGMLQEQFRLQLQKEIEALPFRKASELVGVVRQAFDYCAFLSCVPNNPNLEHLRLATEDLVQHAGEALSDVGLMHRLAFEVAINRYGNGGGLSAHRDLKRHPDVLAIWNVCGSCNFEVLSDRDGEVVQSFRPRPGDLTLLRGMGSPDQRPFHRVCNIGEGPRVSVTIRHNTNPGNLIENFLYANT